MSGAQGDKQAQDKAVSESTVNVSSKTVAETLLTQAGLAGSETATPSPSPNNAPNPAPSSSSSSASAGPSGSDAAPKSLSSANDQDGGGGLATGHAIAIGLGVSALCTLAIIAILVIRKKRERQKKQGPDRFTRSDSYLEQMKTVSDIQSIDYSSGHGHSTIDRRESWPDPEPDPLSDDKLDEDAAPLPKTHPMPQRQSSTSTLLHSEVSAVGSQHTRNPSMSSLNSNASTVVPLRLNKSPFSDDKAVKSENESAPEELELPRPPKPTHASKASLASSIKTSTTSWYSEYTRKDALSVDMTNAKTMSSVNPFYYDSV